MVLFAYSFIKENLYLKSYLSGSKIGTATRSHGRAFARGAYMWSNTSVKKRAGSSFGGLYAGGGGGNTVEKYGETYELASGKVFHRWD